MSSECPLNTFGSTAEFCFYILRFGTKIQDTPFEKAPRVLLCGFNIIFLLVILVGGCFLVVWCFDFRFDKTEST